MQTSRLLWPVVLCAVASLVAFWLVAASGRSSVCRHDRGTRVVEGAAEPLDGSSGVRAATDPDRAEAPTTGEEKKSAETSPEGTGSEVPPPGAGVATEAQRAPTVGSLRVRVTDELGAPWSGLEVQAARPADAGASAERALSTGQDGTCEFESLATGEWVVGVHAGGSSRFVPVTVLPGDSNDLLEIVVPRNGALLVGTVRHVGGEPIPDAGVCLHDRDIASGSVLRARADDQGNYRIEVVPLGTYRVSVADVTSLGDQVLYCPDLHVSAYGEIRRDLVVGFVSLSGVVRDADTQLPISGAILKLTKPTGTSCISDSEGAFQFFDVPSGPGQLMVTRSGYGLTWVELGKLDAAVARRQDIELQRAALLDVYLSDERGDPVPGASYLDLTRMTGERPERRGESYSVTLRTDVDGYACYSKIRPGIYEVFVRRDDCATPTQRIEVRPGENTVRLQLPGVHGLQRCDVSAMVLRGRVTKAGTGEPIRGVRLWLKASPPRETYSDAQGEYGFPDLPSGVYRLVVERDGFGLQRLEAQVEAGQQCILNAELQVAAVLHLKVTDQAGRPISGRVVIAIAPATPDSPTSGGGTLELEEDGTCTYTRIVPGSYDLSLRAIDVDGRASVPLNLEPGGCSVAVTLK